MAATITINGKTYPVPDTFTLGEEAEIETICGQGYDLLAGGVKAVIALAYVSAKRVDPNVSLDDIRALSADDLSMKRDEEATADVPPASVAA